MPGPPWSLANSENGGAEVYKQPEAIILYSNVNNRNENTRQEQTTQTKT